jgi:hypothetical protein
MSDEVRMRNYRAQIEKKNEIEVRDISERHLEELQRMNDAHALRVASLRQAYDVQLSEEAESLLKKLEEIHTSNEERVGLEKRTAEEELMRTRNNNQKKLDDLRKKGELQLESLQNQFKASTDAMHEQAKKTARRERENLGHDPK